MDCPLQQPEAEGPLAAAAVADMHLVSEDADYGALDVQEGGEYQQFTNQLFASSDRLASPAHSWGSPPPARQGGAPPDRMKLLQQVLAQRNGAAAGWAGLKTAHPQQGAPGPSSRQQSPAGGPKLSPKEVERRLAQERQRVEKQAEENELVERLCQLEELQAQLQQQLQQQQQQQYQSHQQQQQQQQYQFPQQQPQQRQYQSHQQQQYQPQQQQQQQQQSSCHGAAAMGAGGAAAFSSAAADETWVAQQLASLGYTAPSMAVPPAALGDLTNGNIRQRAPRAHAAAAAALELREEAAVGRGIGSLPAGENTVAWGGGGEAVSTAEEKQRLRQLVQGLNRGRGCGVSLSGGYYGLSGPHRPPQPYSPQQFAEDGSVQPLQEAKFYLGQMQGTMSARVQPASLSSDPSKLAKLLPNQLVFCRATTKCLLQMVEDGWITAATLPLWEVFVAAWERLAVAFSEKNNWPGFLAANHKAWMAMWEEGLPPDADYGRIDVIMLLRYYLFSPKEAGTGGSSGSNSGNSSQAFRPGGHGKKGHEGPAKA